MNISVNLTPETGLEQALKNAGIENPASVTKLTVTGMITEDDCIYLCDTIFDGLQELDMANAAFWENKMPYPICSCHELVSVTIPNWLVNYYGFEFDFCYKLTSITALPENPYYVSIDGVLFNKRKTELILYPAGRQGDYVIPDSTLKIKCNAFRFLTPISITIPASVIEIERCAVRGCHLTVHPDNPEYSSENGVLFNKDKTELISYPRGKQVDYALPDSVIDLWSAASLSKRLKSGTVPDSATRTDFKTFSDCEDLTSVISEKIKQSVSAYRSNLTSVTIPDSVVEIGNYAFACCKGLKSVYIPMSVVKIGKDAFSDCPAYFTVHPDNPAYKSENGVLKPKSEK